MTIQVIVKDSFSASTGESASASYTAKSRIVGTSAVISPDVQPAGRPVQRAPYRWQFDVRAVQSSRPQPVLAEYRSAAHCAGGEHQLHRSWHAAQHDIPHEVRLERWDSSAPLPFTTGTLPTNLKFPTVTDPLAPTPSS